MQHIAQIFLLFVKNADFDWRISINFYEYIFCMFVRKRTNKSGNFRVLMKKIRRKMTFDSPIFLKVHIKRNKNAYFFFIETQNTRRFY